MDFHIHGMDVKKNKSIMDFFMLREKQVVSEGKTARIHHGFAWIRFLREKQAVSEGKRAHTPALCARRSAVGTRTSPIASGKI